MPREQKKLKLMIIFPFANHCSPHQPGVEQLRQQEFVYKMIRSKLLICGMNEFLQIFSPQYKKNIFFKRDKKFHIQLRVKIL